MSQRGLLLRFLTAVLTAIVLFSLAGFQVTTQTAGVTLLSRLSAALIEFDRWLPEHRDDLDLLARDRPAGFVRPDLPVPVSLPARSLIGASDDVHRALILDAMGRALYVDGLGAFTSESSVSQAPSLSDPTHWAIVLLSRDAHGFWLTVLPIALLLLIAATIGTLLSGSSPLPGLASGAVVAAVLSLGIWLLSGLATGLPDSATNREIALLLRDGAWIGVRNGVAVLAASVGLMAFFHYVDVFRLPIPEPSPPPSKPTPDLSAPSDLPPY